jgi:hypothetical protein
MKKNALLALVAALAPIMENVAEMTAMAAETADNLAGLTAESPKDEMRQFIADAHAVLSDLYGAAEEIEAAWADICDACDVSPKLAVACSVEY